LEIGEFTDSASLGEVTIALSFSACGTVRREGVMYKLAQARERKVVRRDVFVCLTGGG
jgi:hypothetical protein